MPELPEVETVARQLAPLVRGQQVRGFQCLDDRLAFTGESSLVGRTLDDVFRVGKQVVLSLTRGASRIWLCVHLRMTGRLVVVARGTAAQGRHLRALFELDDARLEFHDPRRFGTFRVVHRLADARGPGLEPLKSRFTAQALAELLGTSRQPLKNWLLRQDRIVGLGNIYASEILHAARLHPLRAAGDLSPAEVRRLHRATRRVLRAAIACCGTTFSDFQDARGVSGGFQEFLQVYGRGSEACRRCCGTVERTVVGGRATFACPRCQPLEPHRSRHP
jgi:formamidopyrimidine-DNA glycosylase